MLINHDKPLDFKGIYPFSEQSTRGPKQPPVGVWASASSSAGPSLWVPASPWHSLEVAHCRLGKSCRKPWVKKLFLSLSLSLSLSVCLVMCVCVCVCLKFPFLVLFVFVFFQGFLIKCWVLQGNWHESQAKLSKCLWECSKTAQNIILNHVETALPGAAILFFFRSNFYIQLRLGCRSVESYPTWRCLLRETMFIYVWWIVSWQLFLFLSSCFRKNGGCRMICWKQLRTFRMHELPKPNVQSFQTLRLTEIQWVFDSPHPASF